MWKKARLKAAIDRLPDSFIIDELIEKLILMDKVERGNRQLEKGEIMSEENLDKEIEKWFE